MTLTTTNNDDFSKALVDMEQTQVMCDKLLQTKHYQKMGPEGVYALVAKAKSLGISPLEALNGGLYFVQGKVGMSTETMASLIRQAGHSVIKDPKSDNAICILHGKRKDNGDTWTCVFSMDDAKRAGLVKSSMYDKYPGTMLYNRCMSLLARQLFPDVIKGCGYNFDELKEISENNNYKSKNDYRTLEVKPSITPEQEEKIASAEKVTPIKKPAADEIETLKEMFNHCEQSFIDAKTEMLKKIPGYTDLADINIKTYTWLMDAINQHRDQVFSAMTAEAADENLDKAYSVALVAALFLNIAPAELYGQYWIFPKLIIAYALGASCAKWF